MLTRERNELLTRVGRGTPCGELLRRYWHPVAAAGELTQGKPIKAVKILGEELVVYRDKRGQHGLVGEHCPHRLASLAYGRVDDEGFVARITAGNLTVRQMPGAAGGAGKQHVQGPDQTCRLSSGDTGWIDFRLLRSGAAAFVAAMGCAGLGKWQALDRQGIDHRL